MNNWFGLLISYLYIFTIIGMSEALRRWRSYSSDFTRKFIHMGVGMLIWFVPLLFNSPWPFVFASFTFVIINLLDWHFGFISSMTSTDRSNLGTVYFPIAAAAAALIFWDSPPLMVAALMPLTWGDGFASVIGRAYGRHPYTVLGHTRTLEGSSTFFVIGGLFTWLALWAIKGSPDLSPAAAFLPAIVVTVATTLTEAVSIRGLDNLTITAVAIAILSIWQF